MTVCRYFLNGNCRYGQNCRFEHVYDDPSFRAGGGGGGHSRNQYSQYNYNPAPQQSSTRHGGQQGGGTFNFGQAAVELATQKTQEMDQTRRELQHIVEGRLYPFTVIPGASSQMNFKHLSDLSPEEIRLKAYESLAANRFDEHQSEMSKYLSHVLQIMRGIVANPQLLQDSQPKPGAGPVVCNNDQGTHSMTPRLFNPNPLASGAPPVAQSVLPSGGPALFSQQNLGFLEQQSNASHFQGRTIQGPASNMNAPVHQSAPANQTTTISRELTMPSGQFATQGSSNKQQAKDTTYTPMELLSQDDLAAFRDRVFTLDNLPLVAPPRELC